MLPNSQTRSILGLDVGERRIGVAIANSLAKLPSPLKTLPNDPDVFDNLKQLITENQVDSIVVGLPRGLNGQDTIQTKFARDFAERLKQAIGVKIYLVDEAVTSVKAESELMQRQKNYSKDDIDSLAAVYILEDYLGNQQN